jgi:hypothetical protein
MGNSIEKNQEKVESLLVNISVAHNWINYGPEIKTSFITFRTRCSQKKVYSDLKQELLVIIDTLNATNPFKSTMDANLTNGGELYKTFIKNFIELHGLLVRLEILQANNKAKALNSEARYIAAAMPYEN